MIRILCRLSIAIANTHVALMDMDEEHEESKDLDDGRSNVIDQRNSSPVESVSVKKQPPPESRESIRVRSLVIGSFWAIVVFLGLPIWWWTTSIYRARLPLQEMLEWADGKVCSTESNDIVLLTPLNNNQAGVQIVVSTADCYRCTVTTRE